MSRLVGDHPSCAILAPVPLPSGVTTCELTFGPSLDENGSPEFVGLTGRLVASRRVTHRASGTSLVIAAPVVIGSDGTAEIIVPHTGQPELDRDFRYVMRWDATSRATPGNKTFALPQAAGGTVKYELLAASLDVPGIEVPVVARIEDVTAARDAATEAEAAAEEAEAAAQSAEALVSTAQQEALAARAAAQSSSADAATAQVSAASAAGLAATASTRATNAETAASAASVAASAASVAASAAQQNASEAATAAQDAGDSAAEALTLRDRATHTGTQSLDTTTDSAGRLALVPAERTKLAGIAAGATVNAADEVLRDRANHTGVQPSHTISDLREVIQDTVGGLLQVAGIDLSITYEDRGDASGALVIDYTGVTNDPEAIRDAVGAAMVGLGNITVLVNDDADTITILTSATVNDTDANLRDRATHSGQQTAATISDFATAAQAALAATVAIVNAELVALDGRLDTAEADLAAATASNSNDTLVRRSASGIVTVNQLGLSGTAPTAVTHATRKDYVDALVQAANRRPVNSHAITAYTLAATDEGKLVYNAATTSPVTYTVPDNTAVPIPVGAWIDVARMAEGAVSIARASGVTLIGADGLAASSTKTIPTIFGTVRLYKYAPNSWLVTGDFDNATQRDLTAASYSGSANTLARRSSAGNISFNRVIVAQAPAASDEATRRDYVDAGDAAGAAYTRSFSATDLVANGSGYLGTNYNFSSFTFNPADAPIGGGSFVSPLGQSALPLFTDELMPVDLSRKYLLRTWARQTRAGVVAYAYNGVAPYDIDGLSIVPLNYMFRGYTTTTLAAALKPGDTTVTLTSAANWNNAAGTNSHFRSIIVWNYTDGKGKTWGPETYSRRFKNNAYADGGISGNVITLSAPFNPTDWGYPANYTIPAGTSLSNGSSGGNYMYGAMQNTAVPEVWTAYQNAYAGGTMPIVNGGRAEAATSGSGWPPGTAFVKVVVLVNRQSGGAAMSTSQHAFASVSFSDATWSQEELVAATDAATGGALVRRTATGALSASQVQATTAAPTSTSHLTRKDYVDTYGSTQTADAASSVSGNYSLPSIVDLPRTRTLTLAGNLTMLAPTALSTTTRSHTVTLVIKQPASGGPFTVTWPTIVWAEGAPAPVMPTAPNAELIVDLFWTGTVWRGMVIGRFYP